MSTLFLGSCDTGKIPADRKRFLAPYHKDGLLVGKVSFRDDDRTTWRSFREENGSQVKELQEFLFKAGFMPRGVIDGIFDYVTQAAARLFQEYVRTLDPNGDKSMVPDGIVGNGTMKHVQRWKDQHIVADWGKGSPTNSSKEYKDWIALLNKAKTHYMNNPGPIMQHVNGMNKTYSTIKVKDWNFDTDKIHLIGIRRKEDTSISDRKNDDIFVLLINGMVFKFWGSTDPSVRMARRKDEAFLVEGQHKYRFGWHKISIEKKIYRALKPFDSTGVLVLRDWNDDNALTSKDLEVTDRNGVKRGVNVNNSINIHWSGIGGLNYSAGCQVVSGRSYINNRNETVSCKKFASNSYGDLNSGAKKTKGAYNVLADMIVCYSKKDVNSLYYTLGREESLDLDANIGANYALDALTRMTSV
ncbi:peptidoglycan-binding domain-containing protein [Ulvibacter antarcticus]|uniref:Peptidoglycan binding-like domain-containing protein n=1 Tax=Ulvibacter antarcticus TaxID=442714 RepID=A0A3L9YZ73_9FLAO|nr:peptidoglycan-binding domain-containing protein [Ulvibacter antarcticus]RMA64389.1 hypothetical protein BXY75_1264 [Ulvibacter antarcticus]